MTSLKCEMPRRMQWREAWRAHPLRRHLGLLLFFKLIALILIYNFFFSPAQRVHVSDDSVAQKMLHMTAPAVGASHPME